MAADILVVDDERDIRELVAGILQDEGFEPRVAANSDEVFQALKDRVPSLVVLDIWLQDSALDGLEILAALRKSHADLPVLIISGHGTIETAVAAIRKGAYDFIEKPFNADKLVLTVNRALETQKLRRENQDLRERAPDIGLIGPSLAMVQLRGAIEKVADANSRVLISGATGSGKELVARSIHAQSQRASRPFVVISAASISPENMEKELFGIEGSDNTPKYVGCMERAHGGTLLFEEIADMPFDTQRKILRVLVEQKFTRVGGANFVEVDVRILSTTAKDLEDESEKGRFRKDLLHRINVVTINVPSLASRREDIPDLADILIDDITKSGGVRKKHISPEALTALQSYHWPGNVRQLRNVIERTLILMDQGTELQITIEKLPADIIEAGPTLPAGEALEQIVTMPLREAREKFEREYLIVQINRFGGNISRTSNFIGMERSALHRKLKSLGIVPHQRADIPLTDD